MKRLFMKRMREWWRRVFTFSSYPPITSLLQPSSKNIYSQENISQFPLSTSAAAPRPRGSSITLIGWHWIYLLLDICYCLNSTPTCELSWTYPSMLILKLRRNSSLKMNVEKPDTKVFKLIFYVFSTTSFVSNSRRPAHLLSTNMSDT